MNTRKKNVLSKEILFSNFYQTCIENAKDKINVICDKKNSAYDQQACDNALKNISKEISNCEKRKNCQHQFKFFAAAIETVCFVGTESETMNMFCKEATAELEEKFQKCGK